MKEKMRTIKVFPDYCSSGLWEDGANIDKSEFDGMVPETALIALKYWHWIWEVCQDDDYNLTFSPRWHRQWWEDGKDIIDCLNRHTEHFHDIQFIYDVKEPE
jgi:hypothetical protein